MRNVDSLNNIVTEYEDIDISTYFKAMDITKEQQEEREEAAEDIWWLLLLLFALIESSIEDGDLDYAFIYETFVESYTELVSKYARADDYINQYIADFTRNTLGTTWEHIDFNNEKNYWTSNQRALNIAVNEANSILNYENLQKAIDEGKTHKKWVAEKDNKTRSDHNQINGVTIPIEEYFKFPDCKMLMPHDEVNGTARQTVNCRCSLDFLSKDKTDDNAEVIIPDDYDREDNSDEIHTAYWIAENMGGRIELLNRSEVEGVKTPDYMWNGKLWELKNPTTSKAPDSALRSAIKQIKPNPGGVILDFGINVVNMAEAIKEINSRLRRSGKFDFDVLVIQNDELIEHIKHRI